ncbi:ATP-dependent helicase [Spiroplasma taiwanense]|uniref:DNA 3'-5' helicase n=1 Tax=Spiroplasma taiwanense CT-1 TaxID=1276220 RepID=S5LSY9_9MOLU|nr:UvrD-helicase domain-containing protein [Spiroplasma taiwanense]AGR40794.1 ATP-dependent DNA helicase [Spiroplasma taiwanense CT-1]
MNDLLKQLNDEQLDSVITTDVPLIIIAGAGSGKTRVITYKIAYLIEKLNILPYKILAVTFTNKAAQEMKQRIGNILPNLESKPLISTFHSLCVRILREDGEYIGLEKNFTIIDSSDQFKIVRQIMKDLGIDIEKEKVERKIILKISKWKNSFTPWENAFAETFKLEEKKWAKVYRDYEAFLLKKKFLDFDDLILKVHKLFLKNLNVQRKWRNKFDYVLVDEFQDTNYAQFDLIKGLVGSKNNLTVVGDSDQTIYSWRGAKVNIILNFNKEFRNARTIVLNENYRSTKSILDLANNFIENNKNREKKDIFTKKDAGEMVYLKEAASRNFEAKYVALKIKELIKQKNYNYSDFFVLFRMNAWLPEFEKEFQNYKIPFQLIGGFQFRERKIIKDITALLKVVALKNDIALERVLAFTPKVGAVTIDKLFKAASENNVSLFDFLLYDQEKVLQISKNLKDLIFCLLKGRQLFEKNSKIVDIAQTLVAISGYNDRLDLKIKEDEEALQNLKAYYDKMEKFDFEYETEKNSENRLILFLQNEALTNVQDDLKSINKVALLTIHAAKGLENKIVFIVGLNKDVFPSKMSFNSIDQLEEERRAFYVAITRAQELLYISYVTGGYSYISNGELGASRFISELDPNLYEIEKNIYFHSLTEKSSSFKGNGSLLIKKQEKYEAGVVKGDKINHMMFGEGIVVKVVDKFISVAFSNPTYGVKSLPIKTNAWEKM